LPRMMCSARTHMPCCEHASWSCKA
jgi:hypothetical protein